MKITAQLWGNSLGVRIPAVVAREAELTHGSQIDLQVDAGRIVLTPTKKKKRYALNNLLSKVKPDNLPGADIWGAPVGREVW